MGLCCVLWAHVRRGCDRVRWAGCAAGVVLEANLVEDLGYSSSQVWRRCQSRDRSGAALVSIGIYILYYIGFLRVYCDFYIL